MYRIQASILCRQIAMQGYWVRVTHQRGDYRVHIAFALSRQGRKFISTDPQEIRDWLSAHPIEEKH